MFYLVVFEISAHHVKQSNSTHNHAGKLLFKETIKDGQFYITSDLFLGSKQVAEDGILQPQGNTKVHYKPFGDDRS